MAQDSFWQKRDYSARTIAERNIVPSLLYFALFICVSLVSPDSPIMNPLFKKLGYYFFAATSLSFAFSFLGWRGVQSRPKNWRWGLYFAMFLLSAIWGWLSWQILDQFSLGWVALCLLLFTFTLAAIHLSSCQPNFKLAVATLSALILPSAYFCLFNIDNFAGRAIGTTSFGIYFLLVLIALLQNRQFWKTEAKKSLLQAVIDSLPGTVAWIGKDKRYVGVNQELAKLWQKDTWEFPEKELGFAEKDKLIQPIIEKLFSGEKNFSSDVIDDEKKRYFFRAQKYNYDNDAVILGIDMSDQKLVQEQLEFQREQSQNVARFASVGEVMRDIFEASEEKLKSDPGFWKVVESISTENGDKKKIDLSQSLTVLEKIYGKKAQAKGIRFRLEKSDSVECVANESDVLLILSNLIANALEAVLETKDPEVVVRCESGMISVEDNGPGVPDYLSDVIFEPHFTTKNPEQSTGMGLSLSKSIARKNDAELELRQGEGQTTFCLKLNV